MALHRASSGDVDGSEDKDDHELSKDQTGGAHFQGGSGTLAGNLSKGETHGQTNVELETLAFARWLVAIFINIHPCSSFFFQHPSVTCSFLFPILFRHLVGYGT